MSAAVVVFAADAIFATVRTAKSRVEDMMDMVQRSEKEFRSIYRAGSR